MYSMTGTIILSVKDSLQLRQNIFNPSKEYINEKNNFFDSLASSMVIHSKGSNTTVEFKDLDLAKLDEILDRKMSIGSAKVLTRKSEYISVVLNTSFINTSENILEKNMHISNVSDVSSKMYLYKKDEENSEVKENNLIEAA